MIVVTTTSIVVVASAPPTLWMYSSAARISWLWESSTTVETSKVLTTVVNAPAVVEVKGVSNFLEDGWMDMSSISRRNWLERKPYAHSYGDILTTVFPSLELIVRSTKFAFNILAYFNMQIKCVSNMYESLEYIQMMSYGKMRWVVVTCPPALRTQLRLVSVI